MFMPLTPSARGGASVALRNDKPTHLADDLPPDALRRARSHLHNWVSGHYRSVSSDFACLVRFCIHCNAYRFMSVNVKQ